MKVLASVGLALLCATTVFGASTSIIANGVLLGAQHVMVNQRPYTVLFVDGSCASVFQGCDPRQFAFKDSASALAASTALRDQVWIGAYAQNPSLIHGCEKGPAVCYARTPYNLTMAHPESGEPALVQYSVLGADPPFMHFYDNRDAVIWDTGQNNIAGDISVFSVWTAEESQPMGSGMDFDANGTSDILMRTASGDLSILLMDSSGQAVTTNLGNVTTDWKIMGSADFNDDNKSDILWRNAAGDMVIWLMNGASITQGVYIGTVSMDWTIVAVRDFSGDGKADILWQDGNGALVLWLMNGTLLAGSTYLGTMPGGKVQ